MTREEIIDAILKERAENGGFLLDLGVSIDVYAGRPMPDQFKDSIEGEIALYGLLDKASGGWGPNFNTRQIVESGGYIQWKKKNEEEAALRQEAERAAALYAVHTWRQRWWSHPLLSAVIGAIIGFILGRL